MLKEIRKIFRTEHKSQYHPSVQLELDKEWFRHTFTGNLYRSVHTNRTILDLLNKYLNKDSNELMTCLRKEICKLVKTLSDHDFNNLLIDYNSVQASKTRTRDGLCKHIKNTSSDFDELTLNLLSKIINVDFVIFDDIQGIYTVRNLTDSDDIQDSIIFIYNDNNQNFSVVGHKSGTLINEIQSRKCLSRDIDHFMDKHNYFLQLINSVFEMKSKVNLLVLYESLRSTLGISKLLESDITLVNKLTGVLLDTRVFSKS
jgi:hypothetical protein